MPQDQPFTHYSITPEQGKLLESALRIKILHVLSKEERTSKQAAELLGASPGNIHYHIQKLYNGGLLQLVRTQTVGGVIEKYYRSVATVFRSEQLQEFNFLEGNSRHRIGTRLSLTEEQFLELSDQLNQLLGEWEAKATSGQEYGVTITLGRIASPGEGNSEPDSENQEE